MEETSDNFDSGLLPLIFGVDSSAMLDYEGQVPTAAELRKTAMNRPGPTAQKLADYARLRFGKRIGDDIAAALDNHNQAVVRRRLHAASLPAPHLWRAFLETASALTYARQHYSTQAVAAREIGIGARSVSRHCRVVFGRTWRELVENGWWEWDAELFIEHCGDCLQ